MDQFGQLSVCREEPGVYCAESEDDGLQFFVIVSLILEHFALSSHL